MSQLKREFVERHLTPLVNCPSEWCAGAGPYYQLNLRMCQIRRLDFEFKWSNTERPDDPSSSPDPRRILQLDLSLNDLESLDPSQISQFSHLRALNASINRIHRYPGLCGLKYLRHLDLSHNRVVELTSLEGCLSLTYLNLGHNNLDNIDSLPALGQLRELHLNDNQLKSFHGVQSLPQLRIFYCQRNQLTDLVALSSSLRLQVLNAADNKISSLPDTVSVLQSLPRLQSVTLHGNPLDHSAHYKLKLTEGTSIKQLDSISVHHKPQPSDVKSLSGIKELTQQTFQDHIADRRLRTDESVTALHAQIRALQGDFKEYEDRANQDLDTCLSHLDTLSIDEAKHYSYVWLTERSSAKWPPTAQDKLAWSRRRDNRERDPPTPYSHQRADYRGVKDTDEVLRHTYNELAQENDIIW